ncbi:MAG: hypothetical protein A2857_01790 [Candidatus Levybacteria bacterium RIFCSPHIGHO2_01_FULL_36_15]|nr:MAG: hypothetical protein A2857_01790 [Candidatus Levybacteria bacterium RIFCSPHIGHO2_01_FULL_36_15]OGH38000.1 MAG: hypothetical protein A2905_05800 [Candidatus Levybacteria bacterium RIFCSPLOWO2_01_FULL_36_10]
MHNRLHDPQEDDPEKGKIIKTAEEEAIKELENIPRKLGFVHLLWKTQKRILKDKYGIDWKTSAEMNPDTRFD